jgi:hypothetical protein
MDLLMPEVREERREDRRLHDMLGGVRGVSVPPRLGVTRLAGRTLMRPAASAKDAVRNVVCAVIAAHGP